MKLEKYTFITAIASGLIGAVIATAITLSASPAYDECYVKGELSVTVREEDNVMCIDGETFAFMIAASQTYAERLLK